MDSQSNKSISIFEIISIIRRRKWLFLLCLLGTLAPVLIYNHKAVPIYRGATKVIFEDSEKGMDLNLFATMNKGNFIANQIEEMKTKSFAEEVNAELPPQYNNKFLTLSSFTQDMNPAGYIVSQIKSNLSYTPIRGTEIINIFFDSEDRELAQIVTNTTARVMINRNLTTRRQQYSNVKNFIEEQFDIVKDRLQQAENALKEFKEEENVTSLEAESKEILQRITQAEIVYNQVRTNKKELQERFNAINAKLKKEKKSLPTNILKTTSPLAVKLKERLVDLEVTYSNFQVQGFPENNPRLLDLKKEIEKVKQNLVSESLKFNDEGDSKGLLDPFDQIKKFLEESISLEVELQALKAKEKNLKLLLTNYTNLLGGLPEKEMKLVRLMRDKEVNDKLYMTLLEEREKARIKEASEIGNIRILEPARLPGTPISPRKLLNIIVGIFSGVFFGVFLIFILEYFNDKIRTQEDVEKTLGLPVIAAIPKHEKDLGNIFSFNKNGNLFYNNFNESIFFDAYNLLSFAVDKKQKQASSIMLTSATPNEGKSTISSMLAITSAQRGKKTLLIDADLRKPTLHSLFNVAREPGLTNLVLEMKQMQIEYSNQDIDGINTVLKTENKNKSHIEIINKRMLNTSLIEGLIQTFEKNLLFLPSGFIPANPVRIWSSTIMSSLFQQLNEIVDLIIIDSPPIIGVAETTMMAMYFDHILLCVAAESIDKKILSRSFRMFKESITNADQKLVGVVLNKTDLVNLYGSYKYYSYYSKKDKFRQKPEIPSVDYYIK